MAQHVKMMPETHPRATFFKKETSSNVSFDTTNTTTILPSKPTTAQLQQQLNTLHAQFGQQHQMNAFLEIQ